MTVSRERLSAHFFTLLVIAAWAYAATQVPPIAMSGPWTTLKAFWAFVTDPNQLAHMGWSLMHVGVAIAISFVIGNALAFLAHYVPVTALMVHGRISPFLNAFSGIGWALLALLWFGATHLTVIFAISMVLIPFALPRTFGRMVGDKRQGYAIAAIMGAIAFASVMALTGLELAHNGTVPQAVGAAMEGKETRFGVANSATFGAATTLTSTGAVNSFHDSYTALGGMITMFNMMLGEVAPGGAGAGLYGMLVLAVITVFV